MNKSLRNKIHGKARQYAVLFLEELSSSDFIGPTIESIATIKEIVLIYDRIDDPEAEGFSAKGRGSKFIFINSNFNERLQKFTIAHEIYHLDEIVEEFEDSEEDERAADHFAANILLPEKIVLEKHHVLQNLGYDDVKIFFSLADLSGAPYETLYKRYQEIKIDTSKIDHALKKVSLNEESLYLKEAELKFQKLRKDSALASIELDEPNHKTTFGELETLISYFNQTKMEADNE